MWTSRVNRFRESNPPYYVDQRHTSISDDGTHNFPGTSNPMNHFNMYSLAHTVTLKRPLGPTGITIRRQTTNNTTGAVTPAATDPMTELTLPEEYTHTHQVYR